MSLLIAISVLKQISVFIKVMLGEWTLSLNFIIVCLRSQLI